MTPSDARRLVLMAQLDHAASATEAAFEAAARSPVARELARAWDAERERLARECRKGEGR